MPKGSDPGRVERYKERQVERIRRQVPNPNDKDILQTVRKGRRGEIPSPKPNQKNKTAWGEQTIRNNARNLRILASELVGLEAAEYDGVEWEPKSPRDDLFEDDEDGSECENEASDEAYDRLLDISPKKINKFIGKIAIDRGWSDGTERDYCLSTRNLFLANGRTEAATEIEYPQVGTENAAVDSDTVPTRDDLYTIIDEESPRDKALFTLLWESGNRVTAHAALKIKHWNSRANGCGVLRIPGQHVVGLKGAEYSAKPITFARGFLDQWLAEHPLADDPEAPLFCGTRPQDDPQEHLHPHSIETQLTRIAKRTEGVDAENISPHTFKHGRATEMRKSTRFNKEDAEQILDWEEGTPMHGRYEHLTEADEADRILRKLGFEPDEGGDTIEEYPCNRCGTQVSAEADYCPTCGLRQQDGQPRWWRIYRRVTTDKDPVRERCDGDVVPASLAQLPPAYHDHAVDVLAAAVVSSITDGLNMESIVELLDDEELDQEEVSLEGFRDSVSSLTTPDGLADSLDIDKDDVDWLREHYPEIAQQHIERHPVAGEV